MMDEQPFNEQEQADIEKYCNPTSPEYDPAYHQRTYINNYWFQFVEPPADMPDITRKLNLIVRGDIHPQAAKAILVETIQQVNNLSAETFLYPEALAIVLHYAIGRHA